MKKKYKATGVLAASVLGSVATAVWPLPGFWGNVLHTGFLAATIGGMADWFAVTAIFRKPLGISYKTEILIRNRQRIMDALVEFAGQDLLGTDNVMKFVGKQNVAELLAQYIQHQGTDNLTDLSSDVARELLGQLNIPLVAGKMAPAIRELAAERIIPPLGEEIIARLSQREQAEMVLRQLFPMGRAMLANEELKGILQANVGEILKRYEGSGAGRAFVMGLIGLDAPHLTDVLLDKAKDWLETTVQDEQRLAGLVDDFHGRLQKLGENPALRLMLDDKLLDVCSETMIESMLNSSIAQAVASEKLGQAAGSTTGALLQEFAHNEGWQAKVDQILKNWMAHELEANHQAITAIIEERLNSLSDAELVEFTAEKVADDLQMIRINGSVVGALAGMMLAVVVNLAGQVIHP